MSAEKRTNILDDLLSEITPEQQKRNDDKMLLAAKIFHGMKRKGWNQKQFAAAINQKESVICRWMSGKHNFTSETLYDIQDVLGIKIFDDSNPSVQKIKSTEVKAKPDKRSEFSQLSNQYALYKFNTTTSGQA